MRRHCPNPSTSYLQSDTSFSKWTHIDFYLSFRDTLRQLAKGPQSNCTNVVVVELEWGRGKWEQGRKRDVGKEASERGKEVLGRWGVLSADNVGVGIGSV